MDCEKSANEEVKFKNSIIFGIVVTTTWFIYYTNQYGFSHFTIYTTISLLLQLYVLKNIMDKEKVS